MVRQNVWLFFVLFYFLVIKQKKQAYKFKKDTKEAVNLWKEQCLLKKKLEKLKKFIIEEVESPIML